MIVDPGPLESKEAGDDRVLEQVPVVPGSGHVPQHVRLRSGRMAFGLLVLPDNLLKFLSPRWGEETVIKCNLEVLIGWIALRLKRRMLGIKTLKVGSVPSDMMC